MFIPLQEGERKTSKKNSDWAMAPALGSKEENHLYVYSGVVPKPFPRDDWSPGQKYWEIGSWIKIKK